MSIAEFFFSPPAIAMTIIVFLLAIITLSIISTRLFRKVQELDMRQKMFLKGKNGANLESVILRHDQEIGTLDKEIQDLFELSEKIRSLAFIGIHKVGIVRFNPFQDTGSNQSFSIALLDGSDTGIVISSLLSRESGRVYAKPVTKGIGSDFPFTKEEQHAIELAGKSSISRELSISKLSTEKPVAALRTH